MLVSSSLMRTWSTPGTPRQNRMNSATSPALRSMRTICTTTCRRDPRARFISRKPHEVVAHLLELRALAIEFEAFLARPVEAQRDLFQGRFEHPRRHPLVQKRPVRRKQRRDAVPVAELDPLEYPRVHERLSQPDQHHVLGRRPRLRAPAARTPRRTCPPWAACASRAGTSGNTGCTWPWSPRCTPPAAPPASHAAPGSPTTVSPGSRLASVLLLYPPCPQLILPHLPRHGPRQHPKLHLLRTLEVRQTRAAELDQFLGRRCLSRLEPDNTPSAPRPTSRPAPPLPPLPAPPDARPAPSPLQSTKCSRRPKSQCPSSGPATRCIHPDA